MRLVWFDAIRLVAFRQNIFALAPACVFVQVCQYVTIVAENKTFKMECLTLEKLVFQINLGLNTCEMNHELRNSS